MAKCSLCGNEIRFGQSLVLASFDGNICPKCQQEITKKKTQASDCDLNYLNNLLSTATTERNKLAIREILDMPYNPVLDESNQSFQEDISPSALQSIMETTGFNFDGYSITEYKGVVFSETILGTGAFSELSASFSDLLGTKSNAFMKKLAQARDYAMLELKKNAYQTGANAIIGISLEYTTFASNLIGIAARGTAVTIAKIHEDLL